MLEFGYFQSRARRYGKCSSKYCFLNLGRNYERGFGCELMLKDLKIAEDCAKQINANITFGRMSKDIYQLLADEGKGRKDFGIVFEKLFKSGFK